MYRSLLIIALGLSAVPGRALACTPPPPVVQLPGENGQAYRDRSKAAAQAEDDEMYRRIQGRNLEEASRVTIGVITSVEPLKLSEELTGQRVTVQPKKTIRGTALTTPITLADRSMTSCGWVGGGSATHGSVGEYVIVFEGLHFAGGEDYGMRAREARHPELMKALVDFAIEARDRKPAL